MEIALTLVASYVAVHGGEVDKQKERGYSKVELVVVISDTGTLCKNFGVLKYALEIVFVVMGRRQAEFGIFSRNSEKSVGARSWRQTAGNGSRRSYAPPIPPITLSLELH